MKLEIKNLLPTYFEEERKSTSEIWGKERSFSNGDLVNIVAPSGTGKTSLVHFLYKMRESYTGSISYDGKPLKQFSREAIAALRKDQVSIILQDMRLFEAQTILENLEIKRQLSPYHPQERIIEMARQLGVDHRLNALAQNCSYGEQQRAVIIRALLQPFDVLLMDEPFSHLDNANAKKATALILEEAARRKALVIFAELEKADHFPATHLYHL
ncbi:ATP-binding cassette domain-containing protein [Niabella drilacis]|uniref:Putative ABC transport system ATP-binding protein n=1 Tax=Niabella drilacis (strain DSM 25811 / CCM 8410 / CCUG 62505 / LMG 26954 / E90) TaxID=1285928 RepID=A0A1G6N1V0_NIADE|nr:ATP-binding cassette domain-containing protein [Niabella drilacis]SDC61095.1 putative ABC transport system ATP-binding protein [Niabella drilacis]